MRKNSSALSVLLYDYGHIFYDQYTDRYSLSDSYESGTEIAIEELT